MIGGSLQPDGEEEDPVVEEEVMAQTHVEELLCHGVHRLLADEVLLPPLRRSHLQLVELDVHEIARQQTLLREGLLRLIALWLTPPTRPHAAKPVNHDVFLLFLHVADGGIEQVLHVQIIHQKRNNETQFAYLAVAQGCDDVVLQQRECVR